MLRPNPAASRGLVRRDVLLAPTVRIAPAPFGIGKGQIKGTHRQFRAVMVTGGKRLEKIDDMLGRNLPGLFDGLALRQLANRIRAGIGVHAAVCLKAYTLNPAVQEREEDLDGVPAHPGPFAIPLRVRRALVPIRSKGHLEIVQGVILPKIKRLFFH